MEFILQLITIHYNYKHLIAPWLQIIAPAFESLIISIYKYLYSVIFASKPMSNAKLY